MFLAAPRSRSIVTPSLASARDTLGTGLYFLEYDTFRAALGRLPTGQQGPQPTWMPFRIHEEILPFACGATAGVTSWALIYPLDVVKTKVQQRALSGERYRSPVESFMRLVRGTDPLHPKPALVGFARLYRGLGAFFFHSHRDFAWGLIRISISF